MTLHPLYTGPLSHCRTFFVLFTIVECVRTLILVDFLHIVECSVTFDCFLHNLDLVTHWGRQEQAIQEKNNYLATCDNSGTHGLCAVPPPGTSYLRVVIVDIGA